MGERELLEHFDRRRRRARRAGPLQDGELQLVEQDLRQLFRRVDVEIAAGELVNLRGPLRQLLLDALRLRGKRRTVDADARPLDRHQHRYERQLEPVVHVAQVLFRQQIAKDRRQLSGEVGALARVIDDGFDRQLRGRHGFRAAAAHVFVGQRLVARSLERQIFESMLGSARVQQVAGQHGIGLESAQLDAVPGEHDDVELQIVT